MEKQATEELPSIFHGRIGRKEKEQEALIASLYQEIGQLKVEVDWLKKRSEWFSAHPALQVCISLNFTAFVTSATPGSTLCLTLRSFLKSWTLHRDAQLHLAADMARQLFDQAKPSSKCV